MKQLMNLEEKLYRMEKKIDEAPLVRVVIIAIAILAIVEAYLILCWIIPQYGRENASEGRKNRVNAIIR